MKLLSDLDVSGKRVFLRADLDVPVEPEAVHNKLETEIATRLTNLKSTFNYLIEKGAFQIIIAGHMGRPEGFDLSLSTKQLIEPLGHILNSEITFSKNFENKTGAKVVLLENLRFWEGEIKNDMEFAKKLASIVDVYVNDAFGNCHREHASMVALPSLLPHAAGLHLEKEVSELSKILHSAEKPLISVVGGAKIETKIPVIENLVKISDLVLVGGELPVEIKKSNIKLENENKVLVAGLTSDLKDIDEESTNRFVEVIKGAKTVVWNGPMGLFEEGFTKGTLGLAKAIIDSGAYSVVGGGDSTQFLEKVGLLSKFSFVSAGGGAMLEFLSGKVLPGIKALE